MRVLSMVKCLRKIEIAKGELRDLTVPYQALDSNNRCKTNARAQLQQRIGDFLSILCELLGLVHSCDQEAINQSVRIKIVWKQLKVEVSDEDDPKDGGNTRWRTVSDMQTVKEGRPVEILVKRVENIDTTKVD